ncbi:MAG: hypothetical protein ABSC37_12210 [Xanthobacteraceae bacterium]
MTIALLIGWGGYAAAQQGDRSMQLVSEYPLVGDEGQRLPNHTVKLLGPMVVGLAIGSISRIPSSLASTST